MQNGGDTVSGVSVLLESAIDLLFGLANTLKWEGGSGFPTLFYLDSCKTVKGNCA